MQKTYSSIVETHNIPSKNLLLLENWTGMQSEMFKKFDLQIFNDFLLSKKIHFFTMLILK